LTLSYNNFI